MKITFCAIDWPGLVGGPNVGLIRLLPELQKRGIFSQVLIFTEYGPPKKCSTIPILEKMNIKYEAIYMPVYMENRVRWLLNKIKQNQTDIVVLNYLIPAFYAGHWVREAGIPTIGVLRSDEKTNWALFNEFILGNKYFRPSALVCVSKFLEHEVIKRHPDNVIIRQIPSGVTIPSKITKFTPGEKLRIVYTGRLVEKQKRISDLSHSLCNVLREIPNTEAFIYGEGPSEQSVKQILYDEGKDLQIILAGRVDSNKVQDKLLKCHIFVLLSDYEGLPVSLMEAMACGVVPICLRIRSGIPEIIEHEKTGLLVNDRGDDFINAIRRLQTEPYLWERLSKGARAKIEGEYSVEESAHRWELLINELNEKYKTKQPIQIPRKIVLPPAHPDLTQGDLRKPPLLLLISRGICRRITRIRYFISKNISSHLISNYRS
jgi:colanic acid/amylovoran biosynthesis glycosyltransferase